MFNGDEQKTEFKQKAIRILGGFLCGVLVTLLAVLLVLTVFRRETKEERILSLIREQALTDATEEEIEEGKYDGMIAALADPYADYYTEEETLLNKEKNSGTYKGLGLVYVVDPETGGSYVVDCYPGSAAAEAGFEIGDLLLSVDGTALSALPDGDLTAYVQSHLDSELTFLVERAGAKDPIEIRVTPGPVEIPEVLYEMKENGIGYIRILRFIKTTAEQFREALAELKEEEMNGLIIDLRNNPGGILEAAEGCLDAILPEGLMFYIEEKDGKRIEQTTPGRDPLTIPLVLLIDSGTASASEVFAGACKDRLGAKAVGTTTYGKGIVQTTTFLSDGSSVKFTTAHYYTPNGTDIHGNGITPDVEAELSEGSGIDASKSDDQYQAAMEQILSMTGSVPDL